jgi:hypothetical protein
MSRRVQLTNTVPAVRTFIGRSPRWDRLFLIAIALASFALSPTARAVCREGCGFNPTNTFLGNDALLNNTTGFANTANGADALFSNTTGHDNTANGFGALLFNTTGINNTATGVTALGSNTTGVNNTASGHNALQNNNADNNTASGSEALLSNTTGNNNTATGLQALLSNTTGNNNTASGSAALLNNTTGIANTADGANALLSNTTGFNNTASGLQALFSNTTGNNNTASGVDALLSNTTGNNNIAVGFQAGVNLTTGNNNIDIGATGVAGESRRIRIGTAGTQTKTFIAGIRGVTTANANAVPVVIDSAGQLGTVSSSRRFKKEIKPMDQTSEAILGLRPVTFHYKSDSKGTPQFGLIAEEVAQVNPDLVVRDENGEIYTVRYDAVNAMLLNEFLKEHRKVAEQEATIAQLKKDFRATVTQLTARLDEQASQIQKVSAQLEVGKTAPQTVLNNR